MTVAKLREIEKAFQARKTLITIVLISFDSRNDSPRALARFRKREKLPSENWHLLTGRSSDVQRLADRLSLGNYLNMGDHIVHGTGIFLLDEQGAVRKKLDFKNRDVATLFAAPGVVAK